MRRIVFPALAIGFVIGAAIASLTAYAQPTTQTARYGLPHYEPRPMVLYPTATSTVEVLLTAPVTMSQCSPCHEDLDRFQDPWLVRVEHDTHFDAGIACDSCHADNPHRQDRTDRIPMAACFNCHGLFHGPTGLLAPGDCLTCHPRVQKPGTHTVAWEAVDHKTAPVQSCVICHPDVESCNECHLRERARVLTTLEYRFPGYVAPPPAPAALLQIALPVTMSICEPCHKDIERTAVPGLIFSHKAHFAKGTPCQSCHTFYPHQPDRTIRISMPMCYACHTLNHGAQGEVAGGDCALCHTPDFQLIPGNHTPGFIEGQHKELAATAPTYCDMCHQPSFCRDCHAPRNIVPQDHRDPLVWRPNHGKDPTKQHSCADCHTREYCDACHQATMPHENLFLATHATQAEGRRQVCVRCHVDRSWCNECHHTRVAKAVNARENCVDCHPETAGKFLDVKSRQIQVHVAHYEMTNTDPFECGECHDRGYPLGHDYAAFQLCKECHGYYRLGKLVAKFEVDNGELCGRCHRAGSGLPTGVRLTQP